MPEMMHAQCRMLNETMWRNGFAALHGASGRMSACMIPSRTMWEKAPSAAPTITAANGSCCH